MMREIIDRICKGDSHAFKQLVIKHQRLLYSIVLSKTDMIYADDIVQSTWEKVIRKLPQLQDAEKFTSWLCRVCINTINEKTKKKCMKSEEFNDQIPADYNSSGNYRYEDYNNLLRFTLQMLPENQRTVLQLRYFCDLSYHEIALVCQIDERLVKSRLYEAKKRIKKHLSNLSNGIEIPQKKLDQMEEIVMNKYETLSLGAHVFCRLSLNTQKDLFYHMKNNDEISDPVLNEIGKVKKGPEFIKTFHKKILLPEFIGILNYCDRYTEKRLVDDLLETDPAGAELIMRNMFVFEDIVLLDNEALKKVLDNIDHKVFKKAMSITGREVKSKILENLSLKEKEDWYRDMGEMDCDIEEVKQSQIKVLNVIRELEGKNKIIVRRPGE